MSKIFIIAFLFLTDHSFCQPIYVASSSAVSFFAGTKMEDIDAVNSKSISFLNITTGEILINIPNKEFHFKSPLMEEHFNENYIESEKFPKSEFKGKINDIEKINLKSTDPLTVTISGVLTIHGILKQKAIDATLTFRDRKIEGDAKFEIALAEYNIDRPKILWEKMAESVSITTHFTYEPYTKK